jgi:flagellar biosynthesis protein FlhG
MDADFGLANVHVLAGVTPRGTLMNLVAGQAKAEQILTDGPDGVKIICGNSGISQLANLEDRLVDFLGREVRRLASAFDCVIVDTEAGISGRVVRFLDIADDIVVVATPNVASTLDAYSVIKVAHQTRVRGRVRLLVNLAETEQESRAVFERISMCARRFLGHAPEYVGWLQKHASVEAAYQGRRPLLTTDPDSTNARRLVKLAGELCERKTKRESVPDTRAAALV